MYNRGNDDDDGYDESSIDSCLIDYSIAADLGSRRSAYSSGLLEFGLGASVFIRRSNFSIRVSVSNFMSPSN